MILSDTWLIGVSELVYTCLRMPLNDYLWVFFQIGRIVIGPQFDGLNLDRFYVFNDFLPFLIDQGISPS